TFSYFSVDQNLLHELRESPHIVLLLYLPLYTLLYPSRPSEYLGYHSSS
ncbi:hypothetical protein CSUI_007780, partial [Cystoisospora suis]